MFRALSLIGLLLIAIGTGGIKPCVSAFGGDQFSKAQVRITKKNYKNYDKSYRYTALMQVAAKALLLSIDILLWKNWLFKVYVSDSQPFTG